MIRESLHEDIDCINVIIFDMVMCIGGDICEHSEQLQGHV